VGDEQDSVGGKDEGGGQARRLTASRRERFLEALRATGNVRLAAAEIGMTPQHLRVLRKRDPELARDWAEAIREAEARLAGRPRDWVDRGDGTFETIRRHSNGRLQIIARRPGHWSKRIEDRFIAALAATGNFAAAARAVKVSTQSILARRRRWPALARRIDEALEDAELMLEFRLATSGNDVGHGPASEEKEGDPGEDERSRAAVAEAQRRFDPHIALQYLKWREEKRNGRGRRGAAQLRKRSIEEVTEDIVRKAEAIRRHRERRAEGGEGDAAPGRD
jgi:hypothetical protein